MYGSPQIWALSKTLTVTASLVLAFLFAPSVYAGDLGGIDSVTHGGKTITQGETVYRSDFGSVSNNWTFNFSWPNSVGNTNAMLAVIRGTFGSIAGGTPQSGVNFDANFQAWSSGTNSVTKSIGMPPLGGLIAQSDTYTVLVAQTNGTFNQSGTMQWFASGGTLGQEPVNYKLLTFTYSAADVPTQLPGALNSVQYGPRSISAGEAVPQEDVVPNAGNPSQYWRFSFVWPNAVPNQQALVVVFKGTYGALDGGAPAFGVNYAANLQAWAAGANTIGKSMALPGLESDGVEGVYTVLIAERDPKFSSNSTDQEVQWFASGGTQGVAPRKYTTLTFTLTNPPKCCSSVLFLPGFMASRLYKDGEKLWEPGLFTDSTQLLLDETGHPVIPGISAPEVLDSVGGTDIYDSFLNSLDEMVGSEEGKMHEWETFPYDWRKAVSDPILLAGLAAKLHQLAADSNTEKVSIVAHSNGGLLAKALMVYLGNTEAVALVDKIVLVGSPQIGTPKAVGALLHGYEQGIPSFFPVLLSNEEARALAQNMYGAYGLIPSAAYFSTVTEPMITFEGTNSPFITQMISAYESVVGNTVEYREFLTGAEGRADPSAVDLIHPEVLRTVQFDVAQTLHASIDAWVPPAGIEVYQIAGWGEETVKGFDYKGREVCLEGVCYEQIRTLPQMTMDGDGTVVTPSALYMSTESNNVHRYWFDLDAYNSENSLSTTFGLVPYSHASIYAASNLKNFILKLLKDVAEPTDSYVSKYRPDSTQARLRYFLHSPLNLSATDSTGRRISNDLSEIPGARFEKFGEVQYVSLPATSAPTINLDAYAGGSFILDVQEVLGNSIVNQVSFVGIPTTENTEVSISFPDGTIENATPLEIDKNGDGTADFSISTTDTEVGLKKIPIVISADSKSMIVGSKIPKLTHTTSGFVAGETLETSDISGSPECTTTATSSSPVGVYTITCTVGTLQSDYYTFDTFVAGTLTINYTFKGFLKPINNSVLNPSIFKAGTVVPVKFELLNAEGESIQATNPPEWVEPVQGEPLAAKRNEKKRSKKPTRGGLYEWRPKQQNYQYNWDTKGYEPGYWYEVSVKLDDGTIKTIMIGLK